MHLPLPKHPWMIAIAVLVIVMLVWGFWPRPVLVEIVTRPARAADGDHRGRRPHPGDRSLHHFRPGGRGGLPGANWTWAMRWKKTRSC